jgi:uncharacterized membrane protein
MEKWLLDNMFGVLIAIEVLWVGGFIAVIVALFVVKRHFRNRARVKNERGQT